MESRQWSQVGINRVVRSQNNEPDARADYLPIADSLREPGLVSRCSVGLDRSVDEQELDLSAAMELSLQGYPGILDNEGKTIDLNYVIARCKERVDDKLIDQVGLYMQVGSGAGRDRIKEIKKQIIEIIKSHSEHDWETELGFNLQGKKDTWKPNFFTANKAITMNDNSALYYILNQGSRKAGSVQHGEHKRLTAHMKELVDFLAERKTQRTEAQKKR